MREILSFIKERCLEYSAYCQKASQDSNNAEPYVFESALLCEVIILKPFEFIAVFYVRVPSADNRHFMLTAKENIDIFRIG